MRRLHFLWVAVSFLTIITSCKNVPLEPETDADSTQVVVKGWTQLKNYPGTALHWATGFSANNKGYVVGGQSAESSGSNAAGVFRYDPSADQWLQLKDYPGEGMGLMAGFSVTNKTYLGTGFNFNTNILCSDFWEYNTSDDTWTKKTDFPGGKRQGAITFAIGNSGYLLGGLLRPSQDLWQYTPATDQWTRLTDYPGKGIAEMIGAAVNGKAYVGAGTSMDEVVSDFWEYDPGLDKWTKKTDIIEPLYNPFVFTEGTKVFVIGGISQNLKFRKEVLVYDTATDEWSKAEDFEGQERSAAVGFVIGGTAYFGLGAGSKTAGGATYPVYFNDFWKFTP